jgi:hypothetical protein
MGLDCDIETVNARGDPMIILAGTSLTETEIGANPETPIVIGTEGLIEEAYTSSPE